jgi:drug/metabolite transporter (DMT)-like permease
MSSKNHPRDLRAEGLMLICVVIWGSNYAISKYGISGMSPMIFNALRYLLAAAILNGYFLVGPRWTALTVSDWRNLIRAGLVANVMYQVAFIIGLSLTSAANSAIILATSPLWTVLLHARLHREPIEGRMLGGMLLSLAGIVMIVLGSGKRVEFGNLSLLGDGICLAASFLWALNTNLQKPLVGRHPPTQVALVMISVGAVGLSVLAIPSLVQESWEIVRWTHVLAAVVSAVLSIAVANVIWLVGVKHLGPSATANVGNLIPVVALAISIFVLGETFDGVQLIGSSVALAGIWIARVPRGT